MLGVSYKEISEIIICKQKEMNHSYTSLNDHNNKEMIDLSTRRS